MKDLISNKCIICGCDLIDDKGTIKCRGCNIYNKLKYNRIKHRIVNITIFLLILIILIILFLWNLKMLIAV